MKTAIIKTLAALGAAAAVGSAFAAVGYEVPAANFKPSKSRADVQRELQDARADGTAASKRIDGDENIGARGKAGARYSMHSRDEVRSELMDQRKHHSSNMPNRPGDLYFGS